MLVKPGDFCVSFVSLEELTELDVEQDESVNVDDGDVDAELAAAENTELIVTGVAEGDLTADAQITDDTLGSGAAVVVVVSAVVGSAAAVVVLLLLKTIFNGGTFGLSAIELTLADAEEECELLAVAAEVMHVDALTVTAGKLLKLKLLLLLVLASVITLEITTSLLLTQVLLEDVDTGTDSVFCAVFGTVTVKLQAAVFIACCGSVICARTTKFGCFCCKNSSLSAEDAEEGCTTAVAADVAAVDVVIDIAGKTELRVVFVVVTVFLI